VIQKVRLPNQKEGRQGLSLARPKGLVIKSKQAPPVMKPTSKQQAIDTRQLTSKQLQQAKGWFLNQPVRFIHLISQPVRILPSSSGI